MLHVPQQPNLLFLIRFNQSTVSYDATKEDKVEALKSKQAEVERRLRAQ